MIHLLREKLNSYDKSGKSNLCSNSFKYSYTSPCMTEDHKAPKQSVLCPLSFHTYIGSQRKYSWSKVGLEECCLLGRYALWLLKELTATRRNIPEEVILHSHRHKNLRSYKAGLIHRCYQFVYYSLILVISFKINESSFTTENNT
jgi:hypothetical protein